MILTADTGVRRPTHWLGVGVSRARPRKDSPHIKRKVAGPGPSGAKEDAASGPRAVVRRGPRERTFEGAIDPKRYPRSSGGRRTGLRTHQTAAGLEPAPRSATMQFPEIDGRYPFSRGPERALSSTLRCREMLVAASGVVRHGSFKNCVLVPQDCSTSPTMIRQGGVKLRVAMIWIGRAGQFLQKRSVFLVDFLHIPPAQFHSLFP